ncbi:MAG: hypothetical protein JXA69_20580 [Phycisphaerae bacterium]|nr:hypothetical protein [Phycisphaerae bacterium]
MKAPIRVYPIALALCVSAGVTFVAAAPALGATNVRLNGTEIELDANTGAIVRMTHPDVGTLLDASEGNAGLLELAYPLPEFEPLRLASRFSTARIEVNEHEVTIHYERLGSSRTAFNERANFSATVKLAAADDGKSVIFTCRIENRSEQPIPQMLFPDLAGLLPTAGEAHTQLRTCGTVISPWTEMQSNPSGQFWVEDQDLVVLRPGRLLSNMIFRWLDVGGTRGGVSLFAKRWGWDPANNVYADMDQRTMKLRLMWEHAEAIKAGASYDSGEFWLTPHAHGWAEGIDPYRRWFTQNYKRLCPMPERIRNGLGFRTAWMTQRAPADPEGDNVWRLSDLPDMATEAKAHGLAEIVVWSWCQPFHLPIPPPYPQVGTIDELLATARQCERIGVPLSLFVTVLGADRETAKRHGSVWRKRGSYTRHVELLPRRGAWYTSSYDYNYADVRCAGWQADVHDSLKALIDKGFTDLTWDQVKLTNDREPNMITAIRWIREYTRQHDADASFGGESTSVAEIDLEPVDFTWNWRNYSDTRPLISLLADGPRINVNINRSIPDVVRSFADNLYLNVMPRRPEHINGSDWIRNHAELSRVLKQCARLRRQFLPYFTGGRLIGDCVLVEPNPAIHLTAYCFKDRMLAVVVNTGPRQAHDLQCDVEPWLEVKAGELEVTLFDEGGHPTEHKQHESKQFTVRTPALEPWGLCVIEIVPTGSASRQGQAP